MADIVRDAVVRLGIEQVPQALVAPDMSVFTEAMEAAKRAAEEAANAAKKAAEDAANSAKDGANNGKKAVDNWTVGVKQLGDEYNRAKQGADAWAAGLNKMQEAQRAAAEAAKKAAEETAAAQRKAAQEAERAQAAAAANMEAVLGRLQSSFDRTVGGATGLVGAMGALKASTAENLDPAVRLGLQLVGWSQAAKAAIELFQGVRGVMIALTAAQAAQAQVARAATAANGMNATAIGASGAAASRAIPAMIAFAAATFPITVAVTSVIAIITAAVYVYRQFADEAEESARRREQAARAAAQAERESIATIRQAAESLGGFMNEGILSDRVGNRTNKAEVFSRQADQAGALGLGQDFELNRGRLALDNAVKAAQFQEQRIQLAEQELATQLQIKDAQVAAIEAQDRAVQNARQLLEVEKERTTSLRAQVGALDEQEQAELRRLAAKVKGGQELGRAELERFGQLGGGITRDFVEQEMAKRGRGLAAEVGSAVGVDTSDTEANRLQQSFERLAESLDKMTSGQGTTEAIAQLKAERDQLEAQYRETIDALEQQQSRLIELIRKISKQIDDIEGGAR